jgi:hypothetical protein
LKIFKAEETRFSLKSFAWVFEESAADFALENEDENEN